MYVAGALNAPSDDERFHNIMMAVRAGGDVANAGAMPVVPHPMTDRLARYCARVEPFWYEGTAELLRRCDAVYVFNVEHVETSKGTRAEVDLANSLGLPIFVDLDALREWVQFLGQRQIALLVASEPLEAGQLVVLHENGTVGPAR